MKESLTPSHYQFCVEHHIKDTSYPQTPYERLQTFRSEVQELSQAVFLDIYKEPDKNHVAEEIGDVLFTVFSLMNTYGLSFEEVIESNLNKLMTRFNGKIWQDLEKEGYNGHDECYKEAKRRHG